MSKSFAQCGVDTPVIIVDLSADPNANFTSDLIVRDDTCCGNIDNCVQFIVTLNPLAEGVIFDVCEGALPGGALFYQVDCGPPTTLNEAICLYGVGPHSITFCKPGSNANRYCITSVAEPGAGDDITVAEGCSDTISSIGFEPSTILWRSIYPGTIGTYNSYLNCLLGCGEVIVTPSANPPPYVDFQVCGFALGLCDITGLCDTVRVYFNDSLDVSISPIDPMVCYGNATTTLTAVPSGGEPPFTYQWSTGATTPSIDVGTGFYSVIVGDAGGCYTVMTSTTVGEYLADITADAGPDQYICNQNSQIQLNGSVTGVSTGIWSGGNGMFTPNSASLNAVYTPTFSEIIGGSITLMLLTTNTSNCLPDSDYVSFTFTGFNGFPQIYSDSLSCYQSNDGSAAIGFSNPNITYTYLWDDPLNSTDSIITNLAAGIYTVVVTDTLGCEITVPITVFEPPVLFLDSIAFQDLNCFNDSSGSAAVFVNGGTAPYTYNWGANANDQTDYLATSLAAGLYNTTISDANGCSIDTSISVSEPPLLDLVLDTISGLLCYGDSAAQATVMGLGGSPAYVYLWDQNAGSQIGPTATNLSAGSYTVLVLDSHACTDTLVITIDQADSLMLNANALSDVVCFGGNEGSAAVTVIGGSAPYSFLWDANAQNQTDSIAYNLTVGTYTVLVSDSNNCSSQATVMILGPDSALDISLSYEDISCFGFSDGTASVMVSGGTAPYSYLWDDPLYQTTASIENLSAGTYTLLLTDTHNCTDTISVTIVEPLELEVSELISDAVCNGDENGSALLLVNGGTLPYSYLWDENANNQTTNIAINLAEGSYTYIVNDVNNCSVSGTVLISEPEEITLTASNDQEICVGTTIDISAQANGGTDPLVYYWNTLGEGQVKTISPSQSSIYTVVAVDSLGCSSNSDSVIVNVINLFLDSLIVSNSGSICEGESTTIMAEFNGQSPVYSYSWNQNLGATYGPLSVTPTQSTWYTFTIIDECFNSLSDSTLIEVYPIPEINIEFSVSEGCAPLEVSFINVADQPDLNYVWFFGDGGASIEENPSYVYEDEGAFFVELNVSSNFGCSSNGSAANLITVNPAPVSNFVANPWETDITTPLIEFTNTSSSDAIFFTWNFGDGDSIMVENPSHSYDDIGEFLVSLETENVFGCISTVSKTVIINPNHDVIIPNAFTPDPNGSPGGYYDPNDLSNNVFYPFADYVATFHMMIFNRWGELVFESFDINYGWDGYYKGNLSQLGSYAYKIEITFVDEFSTSVQGKIKLIN